MSSLNLIVLPKLGLTMTEGTIAKWHVKSGDHVEPGDMLFVVETDKIATDVEARAAGRIEALTVPEGETVGVGTVVATWTGPATALEDVAPLLTESTAGRDASEDKAPVPAESEHHGDRVVATPLARRLARSQSVNLRQIKGSGPRGRIKADDVLAFARQVAASSHEAGTPSRAIAPAVSRRPASNFEKTVARKLSAAKQNIPHFYVMAEADLSELIELRSRLNSAATKAKITINHFVLLAVGRGLLAHPEFGRTWQDNEIVSLGTSDVGLAVDTPRGLLAPVLRSVGEMRLDQLAHAAIDAGERAKQGTLHTDDLSGGAITVSNVGMYGASWLIPIINPGQAAIVGVGSLKPQYRPGPNNEPQLRQILALVLAADHRIIDGVEGGRFLNTIVGLLEAPYQLVR